MAVKCDPVPDERDWPAPACGARNSYTGRALLELGNTFFDAGEHVAAMPFYLESARAAHPHDLEQEKGLRTN
jgi:hypothetical protein